MKRITLLVLITLFLCAVPSFSQTISADSMKISVPFEFSINGTTYPAGDYTLRLNAAQDNVMIGSNDTWISVHKTWNVPRDNSAGKSRLVFVEENGKHVLHQIWIAGQDHGHDLIHAKTDKDIR
jgi:hypothetical protein